MCHRGRAQMSAGRETENAHFCRIDAELLGPAANRTNGSLRVGERRGVAVTLVAVPIVADESGHTVLIQPPADLVTLMVHRQAAIAAAGTDYDANPRRLIRQIDNQRRLVLWLITQCARRSRGPEQLRLGLRRQRNRANSQQPNDSTP